MKVCFLISVYNSVRFLHKLFYYIHQLNPKPDMTFFIENNSKDGTLEYIIRNYKLPYKIIRVFFRSDAVKIVGPYGTIAHIRQLGLTVARQYNPDYAIFLDDDVYPISTDLISILTSYRGNIFGGAYLRVYPEGVFLASKWMLPSGKMFKLKKEAFKPFDMPTITSGGCLCLSRKIIQDRRLDFYPLYNKLDASEDYGYCLKARELGYHVLLDNTAILRHDYIETTKDIKPWTRGKGGYLNFEY